MKGASRIVAEILLELRSIIRDGITTAEIDRFVEVLLEVQKFFGSEPRRGACIVLQS